MRPAINPSPVPNHLFLVTPPGVRVAPLPDLPHLPARGLIPPELDGILGLYALAAIDGDAFARDELFRAFCPRLRGVVRRCQRWWLIDRRQQRESAVEPADIEQEAYFVFIELLHAWHGAGSFTAYIFGFFSWRLSSAARRLIGDRTSALHALSSSMDLSDDSWQAAEAMSLLEAIAASLSARDARLLLGRVRDGLSPRQIARLEDCSERTVRRDWSRLMDLISADLDEPRTSTD